MFRTVAEYILTFRRVPRQPRIISRSDRNIQEPFEQEDALNCIEDIPDCLGDSDVTLVQTEEKNLIMNTSDEIKLQFDSNFDQMVATMKKNNERRHK